MSERYGPWPLIFLANLSGVLIGVGVANDVWALVAVGVALSFVVGMAA
jgi:hypothetical protein